MIPWRPIAELPESLKDGRRVLLWHPDPDYSECGAAIAEWMPKLMNEPPGWYDAVGLHRIHPTHFAEISGPA